MWSKDNIWCKPGHVPIFPYPGMAKHAGCSLWDQHLDLIHRAAELQVAQIQAWRQTVLTSPLVRQDILFTWCPHQRTHSLIQASSNMNYKYAEDLKLWSAKNKKKTSQKTIVLQHECHYSPFNLTATEQSWFVPVWWWAECPRHRALQGWTETFSGFAVWTPASTSHWRRNRSCPSLWLSLAAHYHGGL